MSVTYFFILLFIIAFRNFIFTLISAPIAAIFFHKRAKIIPSKKISITPIETEVQKSMYKKVKNNISLYLNGFCRYYLWRVSFTPSHHYRNFIYRYICKMDFKKGAVIYYGCEIREPSRIHIGERSIIGDNSILDGRNGIYIGEDVVFASNVRIWTEQHDHRDPWFRCETQEKKPVIIDKHAWIGSHTIILHSVHIGEGAVVAAGAVVTKDVPPFTLVAGIPAKPVSSRNKNLKYINTGKGQPFL